MPAFPEATTFGDIVRTRAQLQPEDTYIRLVKRDGTRQALTYGDLGRDTEIVGSALSAAGAAAGDRVLILTQNSLEQVITMLAAARVGLISVPINSASAPEELAHVVELVEPTCVLVDCDLVGGLDCAALPSNKVRLAVIVGGSPSEHPWALEVCSWDELLARGGGAEMESPGSLDPFQLLLTSGTTGRPKAVIHSHRTRIRSAYRCVLHNRVRDDDILLNPFPAFHINCLDSAVFPALVSGASAVIFEAFSASNFWRIVREEQATVVSVIPTVIRALNAQPTRDDDPAHRVRLVAGALRPTSAELEQFLRRFGIAKYETGYGLTEAGNAVTGTNAEVGCFPPSMGIPLFDRTVDLFDEAGQPVPLGDTGELVVKCEPAGAVMDGYWRDASASAKTLSGGWLHTGDLARRDLDGSYYFVGRTKDVIKRSGENIGAQEVESVLMEHPQVSEVAVVGVPDAYRDEVVMAVIIPKDGVGELTLSDVRQFCDGRLAEFKIPTLIRIVDELPRGLLGKLDKKALRLQVVTQVEGECCEEP